MISFRSSLFPSTRALVAIRNGWHCNEIHSMHPLMLDRQNFERKSNDKSYNISMKNNSSRYIQTTPWKKRHILVKNRLRLALSRYKRPGQIQAVSMPLSPQEMDNSILVVLAQLEHHGAQIEVLKRHIMVRDKVSYDEACIKYKEISAKNRENMYLLSFPYQVGIAIAIVSGTLSLPMVFHRPTADWFNKMFVTTDIPQPEDLETMLEVGAWSWNWMEPPLGTISFLLLTMQLARANMQNLGAKPYTERVKQWRAERLASYFPQYDAAILIQYSNSTSLHESKVEENS